ncbi:HAD ATPase, P-type, IC family protein [Mycobacterium kansasii]|uniref:HAD ATPase, P-type, IC family protein n=1 Tax=Mycobacterium kansasii TaxID=1768 RepID=A0A1V3X8Y1_MYCKA|nr:HAD ATPase, P-type, IC family protein [Mycobacterium kansasii]
MIEALLDAERHVVLITGDHPVTARAIARQLGLPPDVRVVTGAELANLDEDGCAKIAADVPVFARVSPEQKVQIVAALQRCGRVTAMVGDGANDAAAIRMADVGIGVSGRGSSAARGAADIVLTDDDLSALLDALVEGRSMWAGVRDAVTILVGGNVGEVLFTIIGTAFGPAARRWGPASCCWSTCSPTCSRPLPWPSRRSMPHPTRPNTSPRKRPRRPVAPTVGRC